MATVLETDLQAAVAALSARVMALEGAIAAISGKIGVGEDILAVFDDFAIGIVDRYVGFPVDEAVLDLLRISFADVRRTLRHA